MKNKENNYAFIDGQNLNLSIQDLGWKLDFRKFRIYLKEKYSGLLKNSAQNRLNFMNDLKDKLSYKKKNTPEGQNLKGVFSS